MQIINKAYGKYVYFTLELNIPLLPIFKESKTIITWK
jgi:hypothetical protein